MISWDDVDLNPISIDGPHGWDSVRVATRGQDTYCPWWLTFLDPTTGEVFDYAKDCGSLTHRPCAEAKVRWRLDHIAQRFAPYDEIWVAGGIYDDDLPTRMRVRRSVKKAQVGRPVHALWIRRQVGTFYFFATADVGGDEAPQSGEWVVPDVAFRIAKAGLALPGVGDVQGRKGINFSEQWKPHGRVGSGKHIRLAQKKPMGREIVVEAARRLGVPPPPRKTWGEGWYKATDVELDRWAATVRRVAKEMEAGEVD